MWIFSRLGFYSVVVNPTNTDQMQVRARAEDDLKKLISFCQRRGVRVQDEIKEYPNADYPYRVFMPRDAWPKLASELAKTVDYTNFKSTVADAFRHNLYMRVWGIMQGLTPKHADENQLGLWANNSTGRPFFGDEIDTMRGYAEGKDYPPAQGDTHIDSPINDPFYWQDESGDNSWQDKWPPNKPLDE